MRKFAVAVVAAVAVCAMPGYAFAAVPHPVPQCVGIALGNVHCTQKPQAHPRPPVVHPAPMMRRTPPGVVEQLLHALFG